MNFSEKDVLNMVKIVFQGFLDSLSFHKTIPIIVNNSKAGFILLQIVLVNIVLLIGSLFMYERGIKLGIEMMNKQWLPSADNDIVIFTAFTVYHMFWIVPIYILCYGCSLTWYKDLSICLISARQSKSKKPSSSSTSSSVNDSIYGTLVWVFMWLQLQTLYNWIPATLGSVIVQNPVGVITTMVSTILWILSTISFVIGFCLSCVLYGWYGFDQRWISEGCDADTRFSQIENNILYFIGFGIPYVLLFRYAKFFVAYGLYLSLYPFCMMVGTVSDYRKSTSKLRSLPIFSFARILTVSTLSSFRIKAKENLQKTLVSNDTQRIMTRAATRTATVTTRSHDKTA